MCENYVEEAPPEALQKIAKGNVHFTTSLYKVSGSCLMVLWILCLYFTWNM
jgi:hypothetical protein